MGPFQQSIPLETLRSHKPLRGNEELTKDEVDMLLELEEEYARRGHFQRVYPLQSNVQHYEQFFENKRYQNQLVLAYLLSSEQVKASVLRNYRRVSTSEV